MIKDSSPRQAFAVANAFRRLHHGVVVPDYEKLLEQSYRAILKKGHVVIDLGAHAGRHTEIFIELVGEDGWVEAFEPIPHLCRNLAERLAGAKNFHINNQAVAARPGIMPFRINPALPELSGFRDRVSADAPSPMEVISIEVTTLDIVAETFPRVDYIKIDVEGAEIGCLQGAAAVMEQRRPLISIEYGEPTYSLYGHQARTLFDIAEPRNYVISDLFGNVMSGLDEWEKVCDHSFWDFFLVPVERVGFWRKTFDS